MNKRNDGQDTLLPLFKCYNYLLNVSSSRSCIQCHVKGQGHECMIVLFQDSLCCLSKPEDKPELDHIRKKWMTPSELVRVSIHLSSVHYLLYKTSLCGHQVRQVGFLLAQKEHLNSNIGANENDLYKWDDLFQNCCKINNVWKKISLDCNWFHRVTNIK